jgi:hypothetical protein
LVAHMILMMDTHKLGAVPGICMYLSWLIPGMHARVCSFFFSSLVPSTSGIKERCAWWHVVVDWIRLTCAGSRQCQKGEVCLRDETEINDLWGKLRS